MTEKPGICPRCGGKIDYRGHVTFSDEKYNIWMCPKCGAWGREYYDIMFKGHKDVNELTAEMHRRMMED